VGAHVLLGVACGVLMALWVTAGGWVAAWAGQSRPPIPASVDAALGAASTLGLVLNRAVASVMMALGLVLLLVGLRALLRRQWLAALVSTALLGLPDALSGGMSPLVSIPMSMLLVGVGVWALLRHGLLPVAVALLVVGMLSNLPITTDLTHWSGIPSLVVILAITSLLAYGARYGRSPQPSA
jgi:hypothetical protein